MSDIRGISAVEDAGSPGSTVDGGVSGIRRLNSLPLIIGLVAFGLILVLIIWIMVGKGQSQVGGTATEHKESAASDADSILSDSGSGLPGASGNSSTALNGTVPPKLVDPRGQPLGPPLPDGTLAGGTAGAPPVQAGLTSAQQAYLAARAARAANFADLRTSRNVAFTGGLRSSPGLAFASPSGGRGGGQGAPALDGSGGQSDASLSNGQKRAALQNLLSRQAAAGIAPSPAEQAELIRLSGSEGGAGGVGGGASANNYAEFDRQDGSNRFRSTSRIEAPESPYEIRAGFVVPGVMISGVNSTLPGQIIAQVAQNVYDTARGEHLLIPQGSRLVGTYSSNVAFGQPRILVAWQRIVFPDGKAMDIGAQPGSDSAGYSGFHDQTNNHYLRIFGSALLLSLIGAGAQVGQPQTSTVGGTTSVNQALSASLAQQLGTTATQLIQKNLSIAPTLNIRPGYRFNVVVTKDMIFPGPYRGFDY